MFARLAIKVAKPAGPSMVAPGRTKFAASHIRFSSSSQAPAAGSAGRKMPSKGMPSTAPVDSLPATFTIRVRALPPKDQTYIASPI